MQLRGDFALSSNHGLQAEVVDLAKHGLSDLQRTEREEKDTECVSTNNHTVYSMLLIRKESR